MNNLENKRLVSLEPFGWATSGFQDIARGDR
jgi:hypothetical protein